MPCICRRSKLKSQNALRCHSAFTLIEILVVVAIIAVLMSLVFPLVKSSQNRANMLKETNAARSIMVAYFSYATENDNTLLHGYDKSTTRVELPSGMSVEGEMCCRYPWRLAPYMGEQIEDIFLINEGRRANAKYKPDSFDYQYRASLYPALGVNAYCIGGCNDGSNSNFFTSDVVRTLSGTTHPSNLIVFASARMKVSSEEINGNFLITPPRLWRTQWSKAEYDPKSDPTSLGNVALRWENKAICAFLDGHVALLAEAELRDARHWSNAAIEKDDSSFVVPR